MWVEIQSSAVEQYRGFEVLTVAESAYHAIPPMRKPKGNLVALLAGAVVVVLVAVSWRDIYCHLFLDPRLVGRWKGGGIDTLLEFDRVGNVSGVDALNRATGTYRIDGSTIILDWSHLEGVTHLPYRIEGDSLMTDLPGFPKTFRRVPDDS